MMDSTFSVREEQLYVRVQYSPDTKVMLTLTDGGNNRLWMFMSIEQAEQIAEKLMQEVYNYKLQQAMSESDEEPDTKIQLEKEVL